MNPPDIVPSKLDRLSAKWLVTPRGAAGRHPVRVRLLNGSSCENRPQSERDLFALGVH